MGIEVLDPFAIPLLNTILLLSSGAYYYLCTSCCNKGNRRNTILGLILTLLFAKYLHYYKAYEYKEAGFTITDSVYGTVFFASTVFMNTCNIGNNIYWRTIL